MKVGDLVAYAWNAKERPDDIEIAIVVRMDVPGPGPNEWVEISIQKEPILSSALIVPRFKLDVMSSCG